MHLFACIKLVFSLQVLFVIQIICIIVHHVQVLAFLLAVIMRASNSPADYDSDDEYIGPRSSSIHQPLINRQVPAAGLPVAAGSLDQRSNAWSTRMREKVWSLSPWDTLDFMHILIINILLFFWLSPHYSMGSTHRSSHTTPQTRADFNKPQHHSQKKGAAAA